MDIRDCLRRDGATRAFTDRPVDRSTLEALVDAARRAGSGHNRQPWHFVAVADPERRRRLAECGSYTTPLSNAPLGIVIAMDEADTERRREHQLFDCGRATQNLMLVATANGLGTVPQAFGDRTGVSELLALPADKRVVMGLAVGYPAAQQSGTIEGVDAADELAEVGRKPVEDVLHVERFGGE